MIAVDTNILVYAHVDSFPKHLAAKTALVALAEGSRAWGIPAPCLVEFLRVVTHPRIFIDPFSIDEAVEALDTLLAAPAVSVLGTGEQHFTFLAAAARTADARGNLAFDAAIAAICQEFGVTRLLTEDRDFDRFQGVATARLGEI
jgi:hypothetical protein